ncbi:MAG: hypothetical protein Q3962_03680 [Corynebacterium sp.]|nr:hypothetical protein [Corynebacterium sp.]
MSNLEFDPETVMQQLQDFGKTVLKQRVKNDPGLRLAIKLGRGFMPEARQVGNYFYKIARRAQAHEEVLYGLTRKAQKTVRELVSVDEQNARNLVR